MSDDASTDASDPPPPGWGVAVRDLIAGLVLLGVGLLTGGSYLLHVARTGDFTASDSLVDMVFDAVGVFWIGLAAVRAVRLLRRPTADPVS